MNNNYQMVTVYQYLELLDKENANDREKIKELANRYLLEKSRADKNAIFLEQLLA